MMLGGKTYMEAKYVMPPVAAGCLLQFTYCMYVNVEQYEKRTGGMAVASVLAALVNYVLNYIFIPKFGYIAAAYTTYAGYFSLLIMHMFLVKRIEMSKVYNNVVIFMVSVGTSVLIFLTNFLLDKTIVRYVVILVYVAIFMVLLAKNYKKVRGVI